MEDLFSSWELGDPVPTFKCKFSSLICSYIEALMHIIKGNVGSGIFAMGDAIKNAGIILGPILVFFIGIICVHCQHLLTQTAKSVRKKLGLELRLDFAKTMECCFKLAPPKITKFSSIMKRAVNTCLIIDQLGFCCVYFIFITDNLKQVTDNHGLILDGHGLMAIIFIPILLPCLIRNLKYLTPFSMVANVLMVIGIFMISYYAISDGLPPISERTYVAEINTLPLFFGTAIFCFEGIGLVLPLKNEMKTPRNFSKPLGVLNVGMSLVASLFIYVGFIGYLKFGEEVMGSITLNLPEDEILYQIVKLVISLAVLFTYCLQLFIAVGIMWPFILTKKLKRTIHPVIWELLFRASLVLLTFIMAEIIPFLNHFISLIGSVCSSSLCLLFPALMDIITKFVDEELTVYIIIKDLFILFLSLSGMIIGGFQSISAIVNAYGQLYSGEPNIQQVNTTSNSSIDFF